MRLFLAYELPHDLQQEIYKSFFDLHQRFRNFAWIKPGRLHLTLRFLGEVSEELLEANLIPLLECEFNKAPVLQLHFQGVGVFPNLARPRVFWLGVQGDHLRLRHQALQLEKLLANQELNEEHKPFSPHVTLAKMKEAKKIPSIKEWIQEYEKIDLGLYSFTGPTLFKSTLSPEGSVYEKIKSFGVMK